MEPIKMTPQELRILKTILSPKEYKEMWKRTFSYDSKAQKNIDIK
jgi:hypothetical protein